MKLTNKKQDTQKKVKDKNMNVKFPEKDYVKLQQIAKEIGMQTLSAMIRTLIYTQLGEVEKTGDPKSFLSIKRK